MARDEFQALTSLAERISHHTWLHSLVGQRIIRFSMIAHRCEGIASICLWRTFTDLICRPTKLICLLIIVKVPFTEGLVPVAACGISGWDELKPLQDEGFPRAQQLQCPLYLLLKRLTLGVQVSLSSEII